MNEPFECDDKDTLVALLYDEVDQGVRQTIERHLRGCAECRAELDALDATRHELQTWLPPEPVPGFAIVPRASVEPGRVLTSSRWGGGSPWPGWLSAAAALLMIGVGLGVANVQVRSTTDGWTMTTGWMPTGEPGAPGPDRRTASMVNTRLPESGSPWRSDLQEVEQRLRRDLELTSRVAAPAQVRQPRADAGVTLQRVQQMIAASEERQRQEVAARLIQAERIWTVRRQTDLASVQRTLGSLQNRTFVVQANQQEAINQLRRVSLTPPNQ